MLDLRRPEEPCSACDRGDELLGLGKLRKRESTGAKGKKLRTAQNLRKLAKIIPFPEPIFAGVEAKRTLFPRLTVALDTPSRRPDRVFLQRNPPN